MDFILIRRELLRALRGERTQGQLSRRLGYRTNQVYRWEAGVQAVRWKDFVKVCRVCRADLRGACRDLLKFEGNPSGACAIVAHLKGQLKIKQFTAMAGVSRFKVSRWLSGASEPALDDILELIERRQKGLFDFVYRLTGTAGVPSFRREAEAKRRYAELLREYPWCGIARMCFDLAPYQQLPAHDPGYLARLLRIPPEAGEALVARLVEAGALRWDAGKLRLNDLGINIKGDPAVEARLIRFWAQQAAAVYEDKQGDSRSVFQLTTFSASEEAVRQVEAEVREFYARIRSILGADSEKTDTIRVLGLQLLDLDEIRFAHGPAAEQR